MDEPSRGIKASHSPSALWDHEFMYDTHIYIYISPKRDKTSNKQTNQFLFQSVSLFLANRLAVEVSESKIIRLQGAWGIAFSCWTMYNYRPLHAALSADKATQALSLAQGAQNCPGRKQLGYDLPEDKAVGICGYYPIGPRELDVDWQKAGNIHYLSFAACTSAIEHHNKHSPTKTSSKKVLQLQWLVHGQIPPM